MHRTFTLVLFLLWGSLLAHESLAQQATLRGFVTDQTTEQPLQGATIVLLDNDGTFSGTATDGDGYFIIRRIRTGSYTLRISFVGFTPYEETVSFSVDQTLERSVVLAPQQTEVGELVVEAEAEAGVTTVAAGLQTIEPAQIQRVPVPGVSGDLASYLQTVPGVLAQGDRGGQLFVRGGALDQNLALFDGIPIYMPFHILSFFSAFPEEIINDVDLYTGGFGARYGTRISSVMDVRARNGNKQNLAGSVAIAPFLSGVRIEGPLWRNRISMIASARESLVERIMPRMLGQALPYRFGDQFAKLHAYLSASHSLSFTALHTYDRGDVAGTQKTFEGDALATAITDSNQVTWENTLFGGRYVYLPNALPLLVELHGGYSKTTNAFGPAELRERTSDLESIDLSANLTFFLQDYQLRAGATHRTTDLAYFLGGQFQDFPNEATLELKEITAYLEASGAFLNSRLHIEPSVQLYALPDRSRQWFDPRVRVHGRPLDQLQLHAAWGIYHQTLVGLNDERDIGNVFTAWVPSLEDEPSPRSMHAILGANVQIQTWLSVAVEGFYKSIDHLSVPILSAFPNFTTALQTADGTAQGFDARLEISDRPFWGGSVLDGYVSYANTTVEYQTLTHTYHPAHDRRHQFNALLHAERGDVGFTLQWTHGSGLPFTQSGGFDLWLLLTPDVNIGQDPGQQRVLYGEPFGGRQPVYQRLDLWIERRIERGRQVATIRAGALNMLNRDNLFYFDLFTLRRVDQLPFIPSVGIKMELR